MKRRIVSALVMVGIVLCMFGTTVTAEAATKTEFAKGKVIKIVSADSLIVRVEKNDGSFTDYPIKTFAESYASKPTYTVGEIYIISIDQVQGASVASIIEKDRTIPYIILTLIFVLVVGVVGRFRGLISIVAMILSFLLLTNVTIPQIIEGVDPVMVSLISAALIIPFTFYVAHGFSTQTTLAVYATIIALAITGVLAMLFTEITGLTGLTSDEASAVAFQFGQGLKMSNILIAGMIISSMGVLDDVTISQIDIVHSLSKAKPDMKPAVLFAEAMKIGRDHIASLVNTLVLVYAGAALPVFLVVYKTESPLWILLQKESIAEEIVRTLVSSIGIIAAVPIATFFGVKWGRRKVGEKM